MQIHDFYQKFTSNEPCHLFQALRNLSQAEDLKMALNGSFGEWIDWPPTTPPPSFNASSVA
ncbi:MAG TPA: hypothetical protein VKK31_26065 [Thermoanaerobaculia bacterium]|nr:hypothetical protein [Thermoanaerobaculia bacterium]